MARVFSLKHSSTSVGNVDINSIGTESVYQKWPSGKTECFAGIFDGKTLLARYSQKPAVSILSWLFAFQSCVEYMHHFIGCLLMSYQQKHFSLQFTLSLHTLSLSYTTLTNKSYMKYRIQKIEQNNNQIWHGIKANKTYSCKL